MIAVLRALLDVLFATLWQGSIVAIATGACLCVAGVRMNAATRTVLLQASLVAIVAIAAATTLPSLRPGAARIGGYGFRTSQTDTSTTAGASLATSGHRIDVALDDRAVGVIGMFWAFGAMCFGARILAGQLQVRRLVRSSTRLADRDGARMYASHTVTVPFATGFFTPAIVVPQALAFEASGALDCIVLHEIAHVRRRDVWTNAGEHAMRALLFFNPVIHFIGRAIAVEREAACDDWAVAQMRDIDGYVRALATFALEMRPVTCSATLSFGRATISRLRRLEDNRRNGATTLSHTVLRGSMLSLISIAIALNTFAPAIAFTSRTNDGLPVAASNSCDKKAKYIGGPFPAGLPKGKYDAQIRVRLSSTGSIGGMSVMKSSGNATFDHDVEEIAAKSRYAPPAHGCMNVAGVYVFEIKEDG